ncbi:hypothetical protein [Exiguobacterium sp. s193]|uniref:hypothetical protein n=1 Tax=Exiguobacterium sp. s193 TaxID=2751207 RepID=UPI001BE5CE8D|nr:hypothetical protein [Exiguobacterium sp. s193]
MEIHCRTCTYQVCVEIGQPETWDGFPSMLTYGLDQYRTALPFLFVPPYQEPLVSRKRIDDQNRAMLIRAYHAHIDEIEGGWVPHQYDLFQCPTCCTISTRFWCALFVESGIIEPTHHCEQDGEVLGRIALTDLNELNCPACSNKTLYLRN